MQKPTRPDADVRDTFLDKCIKDKHGAIALGQAPNLPIIVWLVAKILAYPTSGNLEHFLHIIAFGTLFTWAWLEVFQGINYFRRALGLLVLVLMISGGNLLY